jgi:hypothetical protein
MHTLANPPEERTDPEQDTAADGPAQWRLRWYVGDLAHYTAWTTDYGTVENYYQQYRQADTHPGHDYAIERRTTIRGPRQLHPKSGGEH